MDYASDLARTEAHLNLVTKKYRYVKIWNILQNSKDIGEFQRRVQQELEGLKGQEQLVEQLKSNYHQKLGQNQKLKNSIQTYEKRIQECEREIEEWKSKKKKAYLQAGFPIPLQTGVGDMTLNGNESIQELEEILRQQDSALSKKKSETALLQRQAQVLETEVEDMELEGDVEDKENNIPEDNENPSSETILTPPVNHYTYDCTYSPNPTGTVGSIIVEGTAYIIEISFSDSGLESITIYSREGRALSSLPIDTYNRFSGCSVDFLFSEARQEAVCLHFWLKHCTQIKSTFSTLYKQHTSKVLTLQLPKGTVKITRESDYGCFDGQPLSLEHSENFSKKLSQKPIFSLEELAKVLGNQYSHSL